MANNRMYLVNDRLGAKALLAKYYPSTGWYPAFKVESRLGEMLDLCDIQSDFGSSDWRVMTEMEDDANYLNTLKSVVSRPTEASTAP